MLLINAVRALLSVLVILIIVGITQTDQPLWAMGLETFAALTLIFTLGDIAETKLVERFNPGG